jgi:predicted anti-sigma-YlaC factor YlaD
VHNPTSSEDGHLAGEFSVTAHEVTCQQFVELITDYFEGALGPATLSRVEEHLVMCDWCVAYADQMEVTVRALAELDDDEEAEPSEALLAALRERKRS